LPETSGYVGVFAAIAVVVVDILNFVQKEVVTVVVMVVTVFGELAAPSGRPSSVEDGAVLVAAVAEEDTVLVASVVEEASVLIAAVVEEANALGDVVDRDCPPAGMTIMPHRGSRPNWRA
jgi:hypothetical protein